MLNAAAYGVSDSPEYKVQSVQMAPGKRGERPPSYRSMNKQMNKRLSDAEPKPMPVSVWFIAGALGMVLLYLYNAFIPVKPV